MVLGKLPECWRQDLSNLHILQKSFMLLLIRILLLRLIIFSYNIAIARKLWSAKIFLWVLHMLYYSLLNSTVWLEMFLLHCGLADLQLDLDKNML